jgi:hypothetical protein
MPYHIRTPITDEMDFHSFKNDRVTKGDAYIRYQNHNVLLGYSYNLCCNEGYATLWVYDVTNAFKTGKTCIGFRLEARGDDAINELEGYLANVNYNIPEFIAWCDSLELDFESYSQKYIDKEQRISISRRENKGVNTFSPLSLDYLKPLKELPSKLSLSHVRRLLAAGQYSYCGTEFRLTDDYAFDAAYNFGKGEGCGESFLKELTESPSGWRVSQSNGGYEDGDTLDIWCHTFEKRVIKIDLKATKKGSTETAEVDEPVKFSNVISDENCLKPAGVLLH